MSDRGAQPQPLLRGRYSILALAHSHVRRTVVESDDYAVSAFAARSVFQFHTYNKSHALSCVCVRGCAQPRFSSTTDDRRRKRPETARGARPSRQPPFIPLSYIRHTSHVVSWPWVSRLTLSAGAIRAANGDCVWFSLHVHVQYMTDRGGYLVDEIIFPKCMQTLDSIKTNGQNARACGTVQEGPTDVSNTRHCLRDRYGTHFSVTPVRSQAQSCYG